MRVLFNLLNFYSFLLGTTIVVNLPLIVLALLVRKRIDRGIIRAVLAVGFASWPGYLLWRMEWFDMWRHGVPPISYLATTYLPYMASLALLGWFIGGLIAPPTRRRLTIRLRPSGSGEAG
jgi:hypothetical protein